MTATNKPVTGESSGELPYLEFPAIFERHPLPWSHHSLMIKDANSRQVIHLGGCPAEFGHKSEDPYYLSGLNRLLVSFANSGRPAQPVDREQLYVDGLERAAVECEERVRTRSEWLTPSEKEVLKEMALQIRALTPFPAAALPVESQPAEPNYQRAIALLRQLRETTDPVEIQRQKDSWAELESALFATQPAWQPIAKKLYRLLLDAAQRNHENSPLHMYPTQPFPTCAQPTCRRYRAALTDYEAAMAFPALPTQQEELK